MELTSTVLFLSLFFVYVLFFRISWSKEEIQLVQEGFPNQYGGSCYSLVSHSRHPFEDEITRSLRFTGAGILAMVVIVYNGKQ